jgi:hypothetical protein
MDNKKEELALSTDFNQNLKKSIKRNLLLKNILTITLKGMFKSVIILFDLFISFFSPKN